MRKTLFFLAAFCLPAALLAETVFTFSSTEDLSQTKDGISMTIAKGTSTTEPKFQNPYYLSEYHPEMRLYAGNTITLSGESLTHIQLVFAKSGASNKEYTGLSASTGTLATGGVSESATDWKVDVWQGTVDQVVFTLTGSGQRQLQKIVLNGEPIVIEPVTETMPTEEDLVAEYEYAEPTIVHVKDITILKKEYAFIDNNILVSCPMGSIVKAEEDTDPSEEIDNSHPAYFNCNAEYSLTFTATQPIQGIAVDGFVRKAFSASCDHGELSYLTDAENDLEGRPVLVIRDIHSTSVTISCPKQLRCYEVKVYFAGNPAPVDAEEEEGEEEEQEEQGTESIRPTELRPHKILQNGILYIQRGEQTTYILGY